MNVMFYPDNDGRHHSYTCYGCSSTEKPVFNFPNMPYPNDWLCTDCLAEQLKSDDLVLTVGSEAPVNECDACGITIPDGDELYCLTCASCTNCGAHGAIHSCDECHTPPEDPELVCRNCGETVNRLYTCDSCHQCDSASCSNCGNNDPQKCEQCIHCDHCGASMEDAEPLSCAQCAVIALTQQGPTEKVDIEWN